MLPGKLRWLMNKQVLWPRGYCTHIKLGEWRFALDTRLNLHLSLYIWENVHSQTQEVSAHTATLNTWIFLRSTICYDFPFFENLNSCTLNNFFLSFPCSEDFVRVWDIFVPGLLFYLLGTDLDRCFDDSSTKSRQQQTTHTNTII